MQILRRTEHHDEIISNSIYVFIIFGDLVLICRPIYNEKVLPEFIKGKLKIKLTRKEWELLPEFPAMDLGVILSIQNINRVFIVSITEIDYSKDYIVGFHFNRNKLMEIKDETSISEICENLGQLFLIDSKKYIDKIIGYCGTSTTSTHFLTFLVYRLYDNPGTMAEAYEHFINKFPHLFISGYGRRHRFRNPLFGFSQRDSLYDGLNQRLFGCVLGYEFPIKAVCDKECSYKHAESDRQACNLTFPSIFTKRNEKFELANLPLPIIAKFLVGTEKISLSKLINDLYFDMYEVEDRLLAFQVDFKFLEIFDLQTLFHIDTKLNKVLRNISPTYKALGESDQAFLSIKTIFQKIEKQKIKTNMVYASNKGQIWKKTMDYFLPRSLLIFDLDPVYDLANDYSSVLNDLVEKIEQLSEETIEETDWVSFDSSTKNSIIFLIYNDKEEIIKDHVGKQITTKIDGYELNDQLLLNRKSLEDKTYYFLTGFSGKLPDDHYQIDLLLPVIIKDTIIITNFPPKLVEEIDIIRKKLSMYDSVLSRVGITNINLVLLVNSLLFGPNTDESINQICALGDKDQFLFLLNRILRTNYAFNKDSQLEKLAKFIQYLATTLRNDIILYRIDMFQDFEISTYDFVLLLLHFITFYQLGGSMEEIDVTPLHEILETYS